jgi:O-succinylbenzoic acid--CoA ligase
MLLSNRPEFVFVLLAVQRLGAIAVPVGVREQRPGVAYVARQCGAQAIVCDDELADRVPDGDEAPALRLRIRAGELAGFAGAALPPLVAPNETDVAVLLYTSGTTGQPKGAMLTHLAIAHSALHYEACMRLVADDRSALAVPASHVTGLVATIAAMWRVGGTIVVVREFKADASSIIARERQPHADGLRRCTAWSDERRPARTDLRRGASAATAARRCRWRRSTRSRRACRR